MQTGVSRFLPTGILILCFAIGCVPHDPLPDELDTTFIHGRIERIQHISGTTYIQFEDKEGQIHFRPRPNPQIEDGSFWRYARVGDSVYKPPFADSITVVKNGREYRWYLVDDED
jgi:hypothetical protein